MKAIPIMIYLWYIFPVFLFFACQFIIAHTPLTEKFKIKLPDIMTPFLLMGIQALSIDSFQTSTLPYLLIIMLLIGIGVALGHAYYYGDIQYRRFFKIFWRIVFLVSVVVYFLMIIFNIITYL
ncbi:DUF3397 domain-containing protein [Vagococcus coleopterorum]|uniref:DUF3397 domain-containing protein n=1 Tax=Vagococcus coleopterorum TaxID=2714946 RepID=A0A6G8AKR7_9ENTE|nr:DUF3397 domain-containing protein [Vagococcus coleopterorum]QIL45587.1 DUF3397 domain-containing protein [Vagococcus coleopterorum]